MSTLLILLGLIGFLGLAYTGRAWWGLVLGLLLWFGAWGVAAPGSLLLPVVAVLALALMCLFGIPALRRIISARLMKLMRAALPTIGDTEEAALKAGTVWWESDLFSGTPQWRKLLDFKVPTLSAEEQAFLDGPVEELCAMLDEETIAQERDLPEAVWHFIKEHKFLGMVIGREHGGLGFSAAGHAAVITRISTVSSTGAISVMVPNSLGPGELLHFYGTEGQKQHYLPRLARGEEIPCFALTEPHAGSDAANGRSIGVVCRGMHKGEDVLGIRLNFNKRYITLAPIATVIGLAFNLRDPDGLLGDNPDVGITCALLPRDCEGLEIGDHHDPMGIPFQNGPVRGTDVFIPMDYVIGGQDCAGQGWIMLMECLSVGRSISLPSLSVGAVQFATRSTSAYAAIREQFGLPLARFEGVREPLARIFAGSYWMSATRQMTAAAIDSGEKPSVVSGIVKHYLTEGMRDSLNDAMDVMAGAAICRGPRNMFSRKYDGIPVAITVEGANILTRSLIVFGQGAMRCHPFLLKEINAIRDEDVTAFDRAFFGHVNHVVCNAVRSLLQGLTFGRFISTPAGAGKAGKYYRQLTRLSSAFALAADMALLTLGGSLKRKEYLSGRYADALAWLYIASMTLKRHHDEGHEGDWPLVEYSLESAQYTIAEALAGIIDNLPNRPAAWLLRIVCLPFGQRYARPDDRQHDRVVEAVLNPDLALRERLTREVFVPAADVPGLGALEAAYGKALLALEARRKVDDARRQGEVDRDLPLRMAEQAREQQIISAEEYTLIADAQQAMDEIIQVDQFTPSEYKQRR